AYNGNDGVLVDRSTGNAILGNAIFGNGHLGIELARGGNHGQAAPVLTSATTDGTSITVTGTLSAAPNTTFTLELFANRPAHPPRPPVRGARRVFPRLGGGHDRRRWQRQLIGDVQRRRRPGLVHHRHGHRPRQQYFGVLRRGAGDRVRFRAGGQD